MLAQRAHALEAGDIEGYLRPLSEPARAFEEPIARGTKSVALASVDLTLDNASVGADGTSFRNATVNFRYRYKDLPEDNPFVFDLVADIERRDATWMVTSSKPSRAIPLPTWATGPVETRRSPHFLAVFRPGLTTADQALAVAERAREEVGSKLTLETDPVNLIVLARTSTEYGELTGQDLGGSVGQATQVYGSSAAYLVRTENREAFIDLEAAFARPDDAVRLENSVDAYPGEVLRHELGHLALSRYDRLSTPSWVAEAGAMYLSGERRREMWQRLVKEKAFDALSVPALSGIDSLDTSAQYAYANAIALYLVEVYGAPAFWDFYRNFKDLPEERSSPASRVADVGRLVRRWFNIDLERLDGGVRDWIKKAVA